MEEWDERTSIPIVPSSFEKEKEKGKGRNGFSKGGNDVRTAREIVSDKDTVREEGYAFKQSKKQERQ